MKSVLFIAAEAVPFIKTGGLGDVVGSLPKELKRQGVDVRIIMPKYGDIPAHKLDKLTYITDITVPVGWRSQYCGLLKMEYEGLTYYFIDNEYYFKRHGLYGFYDDAERFAFFSRAVLEVMPYLDFKPAILHCHDWHAAAVPALLKAHYMHDSEYNNLKTVLTIHNIEYQGIFDKSVLTELLGLDPGEYSDEAAFGFNGAVNFLKGGLAFADQITTVSKTYAREIVTPEAGWHLDGLLRRRQHDLIGIVNGIDYDVYNPATDDNISLKYTKQSIKRKKQNKEDLQQHMSLPVDPDVPLIGIVSRLVAAKGFDLVTEALDELLEMNVQMVILGTGDEKYENILRIAGHRYPSKLSVNIYFDESLARHIYAAADLFLMPSRSEPCGIGQLIAMRYGCVPIVRETGGLNDTIESYNEYTGVGNGFSFTDYDANDMLYTINRALSFYQDDNVWAKIVKAAMSSDFSWQRSAAEYSELYERI